MDHKSCSPTSSPTSTKIHDDPMKIKPEVEDAVIAGCHGDPNYSLVEKKSDSKRFVMNKGGRLYLSVIERCTCVTPYKY